MLDYKTIGKQIKIERIKRDFTQERVAEFADISVPHLSNIERGTTKVGLQTLVKIANALHVSLDFLLCYETNSPASNEYAKNIVNNELADCTKRELAVLFDIVTVTKRNLRELYEPKGDKASML